MATNSDQNRTVRRGLHTDEGIRYKIQDRHPIPADFDGSSGETAIRRIERLAIDSEVEHFEDGRRAVHLQLWPMVGAQSAISLRRRNGLVVDAFRLHLPEALVPEGPHQEAVETVGRIVEQADPPTHIEVSIPVPGKPNSGVPHVVFDVPDTRPFHLQVLPPTQMAEFVSNLKETVEDAPTN